MTVFRSTISKLAAIAVAATAVASFAATPASANSVQDQTKHYIECLNLLINDPEEHAKKCGPGHEFFLPAGPSAGTERHHCYWEMFKRPE